MKDQLELRELQDLIIIWAKSKNINDAEKQYLKIIEEIGETAGAILKGNREEILNEIGDIAVTVIIYYWQNQISLEPLYDGWDKEDYEEDLRGIFKDTVEVLNGFDDQILDYVNLIALNQNTTLEHCLNLAWNKIKNRKGKTINGTFIKL